MNESDLFHYPIPCLCANALQYFLNQAGKGKKDAPETQNAIDQVKTDCNGSSQDTCSAVKISAIEAKSNYEYCLTEAKRDGKDPAKECETERKRSEGLKQVGQLICDPANSTDPFTLTIPEEGQCFVNVVQ